MSIRHSFALFACAVAVACASTAHASPTPIVRDGAVYVHFGALGMARLNAKTGDIVWRCDELQYPPVHGSGGSPILHDGKLVVAGHEWNGPPNATAQNHM